MSIHLLSQEKENIKPSKKKTVVVNYREWNLMSVVLVHKIPNLFKSKLNCYQKYKKKVHFDRILWHVNEMLNPI